MSTFQGEHLRPHPPAVRVGERDGNLKILGKPPAHRLELLRLEEPRARIRLFQLTDHGKPKQLVVLVGKSQHPAQNP